MLLKTVILLSIGAVFANPLRETPEDLKTFFQDIETQVKSLQQEAMIQIRSNAVPLETYITNAQTNIFQNLTAAAIPYWATIRSLEETAIEQGQDISVCIDLGNSEFYALNTTILDPAIEAFDRLNKTGIEILDASSLEAYSVIQELGVLEEVVALCSNEICATDLIKRVTQYYSRVKTTLNDANAKTSIYVSVYLPELLAPYQLNSNSYISKYTLILDDVTICINSL